MTENGHEYSYGYDKRGNLTEESRSGSLAQQYTYDAANRLVRGRNLETGEKTEYSYNALNMRVGNTQTRTGESDPKSLKPKETSYVIDYLSGANNDLMTDEKGLGTTRVTYGHGYQRISQKVPPSRRSR